MARKATTVGLAGALLLAAAGVAWASQSGPPASAKDAPAPSVSGVTVTAPDKPNALVDRTTEFVRQRLPTNRFEQYARFSDPICVRVIGLPGEYDAFIAKRIAEVARQVNAPVDAKTHCAPNVNVIFSPQPLAQLKDIVNRRENLLGFHFAAQLRGLSTFDRPIQAWYLTQTVDTTGRKTLDVTQRSGIDMDDLAHHADIGGGAAAGANFGPHGRPGSRLSVDMSSEITHALILADANKVAGEKIDAVADYIAVLALSRWQGLERCSGMPTILNLMADGCAPEDRPGAATPADLALLEGLYSANVRESGSQQRATIASAIRKADAPEASHR